MSPYRSVVFDLDGTLVDSSADITTALNTTLQPLGGRPLNRAEVSPLLGEGVASLITNAVRLAGLADPDEAAIARDYQRAYRRHPVIASNLYPEAAQALADLAEAEVPMAVCTNKPEEIARLVLDHLGVGRYFPVVVGGDRIELSKPHPEHLWLALQELDAEISTGLLVGDSAIDQQCAAAAAVDFVAVSWAPADVQGQRLPSFADLPGLVTGHPPTITATS